MAHWRAALPEGMMLEVQYEDVISDLEGQARRIVSHCHLDWDPNCLEFHRNARIVRTASLAQVRRPLYKSSVGRWRAYERFLGPLLSALGPSIPREVVIVQATLRSAAAGAGLASMDTLAPLPDLNRGGGPEEATL